MPEHIEVKARDRSRSGSVKAQGPKDSIALIVVAVALAAISAASIAGVVAVALAAIK